MGLGNSRRDLGVDMEDDDDLAGHVAGGSIEEADEGSWGTNPLVAFRSSAGVGPSIQGTVPGISGGVGADERGGDYDEYNEDGINTLNPLARSSRA